MVRPETVLSATFRRAPVTSLLIAVNAIVFVLEEAWGGSETSYTLFRMGAVVPDGPLHQVWPTLVTYGYLHIGLIHLFMNMYALAALGRELEPMLGRGRYFTLYTLALVSGGLFVRLFSDGLTAGASGAIFGLLGALCTVWGIAYRQSADEAQRALIKRRVALMLLPNVLISLMQGVSFAGHAGGLVAGVAFVTLAYVRGRSRRDTAQARTHFMNALAILLIAFTAVCVAMVWLANTPWRRIVLG